MMRIRRHGIGIAGILVAVAITTGIFRSGGALAGGTPSGIGSVRLVLLVVGVIGIASLARNYFSDGTSQSTFDTNGAVDSEEALEALKRRYVSGEIDEIEYERKLETLFETETVADAKRLVETNSDRDDRPDRQESPTGRDERYPQRSERPSKRPRSRSRGGHCK